MSRLNDLRHSEWLAVRVEIALGCIFLAAAIPKLTDPPAFAKNIWQYAMLPDWLINLKAIALPGIELIVALALITGIYRRAGAWLAAAMLVMFTVALIYNIAVENPLNCSCFDLNPKPKTCATLLSDMKWEVLRDLGMLALAAHVLWVRRRSPEVPDLTPSW